MSDLRELAAKIDAAHLDHDWNSPNLILRSDGSGKLVAKAFEPAVADFIVQAARYFAVLPADEPTGRDVLDADTLAHRIHDNGGWSDPFGSNACDCRVQARELIAAVKRYGRLSVQPEAPTVRER